jgi:hypothetical protein
MQREAVKAAEKHIRARLAGVLQDFVESLRRRLEEREIANRIQGRGMISRFVLGREKPVVCSVQKGKRAELNSQSAAIIRAIMLAGFARLLAGGYQFRGKSRVSARQAL